MSFGNLKLGGVSLNEKERLASSVKLLLLWVAASDGKVEESELEFAASKFPEASEKITTGDLLDVIRSSDLRSLEVAIRTVAGESRELRTAFLDMAITMSMADRRIAITENHILRFYADAFYLGIGILEKRFRAICGSALAEPGDPGSAAWWHELAESGDEEDPAGVARAVSEDRQSAGASPPPMSSEQARAVLGLDSFATQTEIERAYQELSAIFHLDRVEAMGEAAVAVAQERSDKIQQAYRLLREPV
ncbi:MAG: J domain-containing protein [Xanthomonadales bacterium]|nr:J domain-containing protein [Xanthomonadales bacterium]